MVCLTRRRRAVSALSSNATGTPCHTRRCTVIGPAVRPGVLTSAGVNKPDPGAGTTTGKVVTRCGGGCDAKSRAAAEKRRAQAREALGLKGRSGSGAGSGSERLLVVLGGSKGCCYLNQATHNALPQLANVSGGWRHRWRVGAAPWGGAYRNAMSPVVCRLWLVSHARCAAPFAPSSERCRPSSSVADGHPAARRLLGGPGSHNVQVSCVQPSADVALPRYVPPDRSHTSTTRAPSTYGTHIAHLRCSVRCVPHISDVGSALAAADLVLSRAGAASVAELGAVGAPCLLVPSPAVDEERQTANAHVLVDAGAAVARDPGVVQERNAHCRAWSESTREETRRAVYAMRCDARGITVYRFPAPTYPGDLLTILSR